jgi:hypothetical protein
LLVVVVVDGVKVGKTFDTAITIVEISIRDINNTLLITLFDIVLMF